MGVLEDRADCELMAGLAREAARIALGYFGQSPRSWTKGSNSPVSEADIAVDRFLHDRLRAARPDYGWLSEETVDSASRLNSASLFVVDPIDGTRAFLGGKPDWTISLAVVRGRRPVAASLIAPVSGEEFSASAGNGAFAGTRKLSASVVGEAARARVASPKADVGVRLPDFGETVPRIASLALRLARVGTGEIDAAFAGSGAKDWDIAAADLIVSEAGGLVSDFSSRLPQYNLADPSHPPLVAAGSAMHRLLLGSKA